MFLGFGYLSYRNFYPFIAIIFLVTRSYCVFVINKYEEDYIWDHHPFFFGFMMFLAESFTGFIELYNEYSFKRKQRIMDYCYSQKTVLIETVKRDKKKISIARLLLIVLIIALLDLLFFTLNLVLSYTVNYSTLLTLEMKGLQLFYLIILSYFFYMLDSTSIRYSL